MTTSYGNAEICDGMGAGSGMPPVPEDGGPYGGMGDDWVPVPSREEFHQALNKIRETISVKDFGAVGDGLADDSEAVQRAVTSGKSLLFPPGRYKITRPLSIPYSDGSSNAVAFYGPGALYPGSVEIE